MNIESAGLSVVFNPGQATDSSQLYPVEKLTACIHGYKYVRSYICVYIESHQPTMLL